MKKIQITLLTGILLIVSAGVLMASPLPQTPNLDLAVTGISSRSDKIAVGDLVVFDVTYQNKTPITATTSITFNLKLTAFQKVSPEKYRVCTKLVTATEKSVTSTVSFDGCNLRFEDPGVHTIKAELQSADGKEFKDLDTTNNGKEIEVSVAPYQTALPDEIGRIFAGLGLLSAVMAIMAAGTEVIIDVLRVILGMKSKVTATDALERMRQVLPGELAALGVGTSSREAVRKLTTDLQKNLTVVSDQGLNTWDQLANKPALNALNTTLKVWANPVEDLIKLPSDTDADVLEGQKTIALESLKTFKTTFLDLPQKCLGQFVDMINDALKTANVPGWGEKDKDSELTSEFEEGFKARAQIIDLRPIDQLKDAINKFKPGDAESIKTLQKAKGDLNAKVSEVQENIAKAVQACSPQLAISWLQTQRDVFKTQSSIVLKQLDDIMGSLSATGLLPAKTVDDAKDNLSEWAQKAIAAGNSTIDSLEGLLNSVEKRRQETQSPARKVWRALRDMQYGFLVLAVGMGIFAGIVYGIAAGMDLVAAAQPMNTSTPAAQQLVRAPIPGEDLSANPAQPKPLTPAQSIISLVIGLIFVSVAALVSSFAGWKLQQSNVPPWAEILLLVLAGLVVLGLISLAISICTTIAVLLWNLFGGNTWILAPLVGTGVGVVLIVALRLLAWIGKEWYKVDNNLLSIDEKHEIHDLHWVEFLFNKLRGQKKENNQPSKYGKNSEAVAGLTTENAAATVLEFADRHDDEEGSRLRWMRAISVPIGIVLAYQLKVDAFDYLKIAVPALQSPHIDMVRFGLPSDLTAGMILTGFAASAGSAFWHDQLARLQAVKQQAEAAATSLKQVQAR